MVVSAEVVRMIQDEMAQNSAADAYQFQLYLIPCYLVATWLPTYSLWKV